MDYKLSKKAEEDIIKIYSYSLENFGLDQAEKYFLGIHNTFDFLSSHPYIGRIRHDIDPAIYSLPYEKHIIFYDLEINHIKILRIFHASEDWINYIS